MQWYVIHDKRFGSKEFKMLARDVEDAMKRYAQIMDRAGIRYGELSARLLHW